MPKPRLKPALDHENGVQVVGSSNLPAPTTQDVRLEADRPYYYEIR